MTDPNPVVDALLASGRRELTTTPTEDTAVSHADEPQPPIPAEGAPHAYVAVRRTHSVNADRPEWETDPHLIPAHEVDELIYWNTQPDVSLLPIGPDGDTGTRAITGQETRIAELEAELQAERDKARRVAEHLGNLVERQCRDVLDATGMHHVIDEDGDGDWGLVWERLAQMGAERRRADEGTRAIAEPHRRVELFDPDKLDLLPCGSAVLTRNGRVWQKAMTLPTEWCPALRLWDRRMTSAELLGLGPVAVIHIATPAEVPS